MTKYSLDKRLNQHIQEGKSKTYKQKWIKSLLKKELRPSIVLVSKADESNWIELERFFIKLFRDKGFKLTNIADGGEGGGSKGYKHTEEWKLMASKRMTIRMKENPFDAKFYKELSERKRKRITRIDNKGNETTFNSVVDAARELIHLQKDNSIKKTSTNISNCLNNRAKTAWGYVWKYI